MQMTQRPSGWCSLFPTIALLILTSLVSFQTACAQQTLGAVLGTVTDPSGAILTSATIALSNNGSGLTRQTTSDNVQCSQGLGWVWCNRPSAARV
jgi:hypothetical protein